MIRKNGLVWACLLALAIGLAPSVQGAPWRIRVAGGQSCSTPQYLRFYNAPCSSSSHPQVAAYGSSSDYRGWEIDVISSSLYPYDLATIQPYMPTDKKIECRGYLAPSTLDENKCSKIGVALKGAQATNGGYRWRLIPIEGKPNYFNIVANKRTTSPTCQQYLGVRYNCTDRKVVLYDKPQGLRTQWLLTPVNGNSSPSIESYADTSSTSVALKVKRPPHGPAPYAYRVYYKNTVSGSGKWQTKVFVGEVGAKSVTDILLTGLDICDEYEVKVKGLRVDPETETLESNVVKAKPTCKPVPPEVDFQQISWTTTSDTPYGIKQFSDLELNPPPEGAAMLDLYAQAWGLYGDYVWINLGRRLQSTTPRSIAKDVEEVVPMSPDEVRAAAGGRKLQVVDVTSPQKDCAIFMFKQVDESFEPQQYCAGVSLDADSVPKNYICAKASVLKTDPAYLYVCNLNPNNNYYFWMYAQNEWGKGPIARSINAFGELKSIISWVRPVQGACAIDIYIQNEYDAMLGPMDYRVIVYEVDQLGNKVQLSSGTNDPFTFDPLIFRVPAKNSYSYDIDVTISAGFGNQAHDQSFFTYLNGRCGSDAEPENIIGGIYYFDPAELAYPEKSPFDRF